MKFDDFDQHMRVFETAHDHKVLPGIWIVARLDGRNFTRLTKITHQFKTPFDEQFRDYMLQAVQHLMRCGFSIIYGYTQSDEISLLFHPTETTFSRKIRKYNSVLAAEASAKFSLLLGSIGCFDCRIAQLPQTRYVLDYFRWRSEDAHRNALNAHCYWLLRQQGLSEQAATQQLQGRSVAAKNELLFQHQINFNDLPAWQKRGSAVYWKTYTKKGWNPKDEVETITQRRQLTIDLNLPHGAAYTDFLAQLLAQESV